MAKILVVEDNVEQCLMIEAYLQSLHHLVESVHTGTDGLDRALLSDYDLLILDWELPGLSGVQISQQYRSGGGRAPIMMLTGKSNINDKETGFEAGADDYLCKPFSMRELGARVQAHLRRNAKSATNVLLLRDLELDQQKFIVKKSGKEISLAAKEFALLEFFMRSPDQVFSAEAILKRVWDTDSTVGPEALRTCLKKLRNKLEESPESPYIITVQGVGYRFKA